MKSSRLPDLTWASGSTSVSDERNYIDSGGEVCGLETLCRREPGWAANMVRRFSAERDDARAKLAAIGALLSEAGCDAACRLGMSGEVDEAERCRGCQIKALL